MATRRERVVLDVESNAAAVFTKDAGAAALLKRELNSLSGTSVQTSRTLARDESIGKLGKDSDTTGKQIDKLSGRLRLFAEAAVTLGPALIPVGAAAVPALAALATGLGAAAGAAGVAVLAFQGVGDALNSMDAYQLEPTAENLDKMNAALAALGPAGADFARYLDGLEPKLHALQETARAGLFPGLQDGIENLMPLLPQVERIIGEIATGMGRLSAEAGQALAGNGFSAFFDYLEASAAPTMAAFAHATGNVARGLADLVVAFGPLTADFSRGLEDMTHSFADWSAGLSETQGFRDFVDYIRESGPMVADLLGSVSEAFVGIIRAAAPVGQTVVPILTALADVLAAVANSPVGPGLFTAAAGFLALSRAVKIVGPSLSSMSDAFLDLRTSPDRAATAMQRFSGVAKMAAGGAGMALFISSLHESSRELATFEGAAGGALAGFSVGGPWGAAIGGAVGALGSLAKANTDTSGYVIALTSSLNSQTGALTENSRAVAAKALEDAGALKLAQSLGVSLSEATDIVLGNKDAMAELTDEFTKYNNVTDPASGAVDSTLVKQREDAAHLLSVLTDLGGATETTVAAQKRMAAATGEYGAAAGKATAQTKGQAEALSQARSAARQTADAFFGLGKGLDNAKLSFKGWLHQLEAQAEALRNFRLNAEKAADKGLRQGLIKALEEAGPAGALRMKQLASATDEQIARANRAWKRGQDEIRKYTDAIGGVPPAVTTNVNLNGIPSAMAQLRSVQMALNAIHDKTIHVDIVRGSDSGVPYISGGQHHARGGKVVGPGGPREDKIPAMLSNGEFVVNAAATSRHLAELHRINAIGLAAGGTVTSTLHTPEGTHS